jgi:PPM family protein phosphatase
VRTGRASALTDTGRRRMQNEDAFVCDPPLYAVADGMGGAQAGEIASRLAAAALEERTHGLLGEETVAELIREANDRIFRHALADPAVAGMGTTVTALLVDEEAGTIAVGHVGDSRAYLVRDGTLEQLTADHSLVAELVRSGRLTPEEAEQHPHRSVITRALGTEADVEVDTFGIAAEPGDLYLICSDGLTSMIRDDEILAVVGDAGGDPDGVAEGLVRAANQAGGEDNVTVVVFEILAGEPLPLLEPDGPTAEAAATVAAPVEALDADLVGPAEPEAAADPVKRHGAGAGGRWLALAAILVALAIAALLVWWGLAR